MMWFGYYDGWSWLLMAGMMVLFWGGIATLIAFVARALIGPRGGDQTMDMLRRRLDLAVSLASLRLRKHL